MRFVVDEMDVDIALSRLVIAGWTGRDEGAIAHHIAELAEIGVTAPSTTPLFYTASITLATQADLLEVLGDETSGEAEPLVINGPGGLYLGLGSDHTDRGLEAHSVAHSKQICGKPVAPHLWRLDDIQRPDDISLRSWIWEDGGWVMYQDGALAAIRPLAELIAGASLGYGEAMLCGTLPALGGVRPSSRFKMELFDPATGRRIEYEYGVRALPVIA